MKRLKIIGPIVAGLVAITVIVAVVWPSDEPSWHGKTLTEWLERVNDMYFGSGKVQGENPLQAISEIGTNAWPTIVRMLEAKDGPLKAKLITLVNGQKLIKAHIKTAGEKQSLAMSGFRYLGTNALPALPQMLKLTQNQDHGTSGYARSSVRTVCRSGSVVRAALEDSLKNPDGDIRRAAAEFLRIYFPSEVERLHIYDLFPELNPTRTEGVVTNAAAAQK